MIDTKKFKGIVDTFNRQLLDVDEAESGIRLAEDKWSLREIIGHLIDSASNNHQRFVRLQSDDLLNFPPYDAEEWIGIQKYNSMDWNTLATLWYSYNCLLLHVIENADEAAYGNVWVKGEAAIPLNELIVDYYRHLEQHIGHFARRQEELKG